MKVFKKIKIPKMPKVIKALRTPLTSIISNILFITFVAGLFITYTKIFKLDIEIRSPITISDHMDELKVSDNTVTEEVIEEVEIAIENPNKDIEEYNDSNWNTYYDAWKNTKNSLSSVLGCINKLGNIHNDLESKHREYLKIDLNDERESNEINFYEGIYRYVESIAGNLKGATQGYGLHNEFPDIVTKMYADKDYESGRRTKETATNSLNESLEYFRKIRNYASNLKCIDLPELNKSDRKEICKKLINFNSSIDEFRDPIKREDYEFEEGYKIALKERKENTDWKFRSCEEYNVNY